MTDELLVAQEKWLPQYSKAISEAKYRLETQQLIPTKNYKGAARLKTKTVEEMAENKEEATKNASAADKAKERPSSVGEL